LLNGYNKEGFRVWIYNGKIIVTISNNSFSASNSFSATMGFSFPKDFSATKSSWLLGCLGYKGFMAFRVSLLQRISHGLFWHAIDLNPFSFMHVFELFVKQGREVMHFQCTFWLLLKLEIIYYLSLMN